MKKYTILYEEEKRRHEEDLQRYQEDHMDEMEIINLYKRCSKKVRRTPQPKKAPNSDDSSEKEQRPKKVNKNPQPLKAPKTSGFVDTGLDDSGTKKEQRSKMVATKVGKKLKRPHNLKKHQSHQSLSMTCCLYWWSKIF